MINNYAILCSVQQAVRNTWVFHKSYRPSLQDSRVHPTTPPTLLTSFLFGKLLTPKLVAVAMVDGGDKGGVSDGGSDCGSRGTL